MPHNSTTGREVAVFLALTVALSSIFYALIIFAGGVGSLRSGFFSVGLMWCPGLSALAVSLLFRRTLAGLGWRWGRARFQVLGFLVPLTYVSVVYLPIWASGLGRFDEEALARLARLVRLGGVASLPTPLGFVCVLVIVALVATLPAAIAALGEELGWRGFLVPRLVERYGFTRASMISGLIWAVWHYPIMLFGGYHGRAPLAFEVVCFTVMVVAISIPLAWLRLRSGSVWPAVLLHAGDNLFILVLFEPMTRDAGPTRWLTGEYGAGPALAAMVVAYLFWRRRDLVATSRSDRRPEAVERSA